jgi:hypothetical protein
MPLVRAVFLNVLAVNAVLLPLGFFLVLPGDAPGRPPLAAFETFRAVSFWLLAALVGVWQCVGVWRSARRAARDGGESLLVTFGQGIAIVGGVAAALFALGAIEALFTR